MNVRDKMTSPPVTVLPDVRVAEIARLMLEGQLSGLPVVDTNGRLIGLVTERDLVAKHARVHLPSYFGILGTWIPYDTRRSDEEMRRILGVTARDLMEEDPVTIGPDAGIDDAATMMVEKGVDPLPVVDDGALVGVISQRDVIRLLLLEEEDGGTLEGEDAE